MLSGCSSYWLQWDCISESQVKRALHIGESWRKIKSLLCESTNSLNTANGWYTSPFPFQMNFTSCFVWFSCWCILHPTVLSWWDPIHPSWHVEFKIRDLSNRTSSAFPAIEHNHLHCYPISEQKRKDICRNILPALLQGRQKETKQTGCEFHQVTKADRIWATNKWLQYVRISHCLLAETVLFTAQILNGKSKREDNLLFKIFPLEN